MMLSTCSENNKTVGDTKTDYTIAVNENFQIELDSNPTTGYNWNWVNKKSVSIIDTFDYKYIPNTPVLMGSGGKAIWKFKGIKSGTDTIKLEYCRSWEPNSTVAKKTITVKVK